MASSVVWLLHILQMIFWMWGILKTSVATNRKRWIFALLLSAFFLVYEFIFGFGNNLPPIEAIFNCILVILLFDGKLTFLCLKYLFSFFYMGILTTPVNLLFFMLNDVGGIFLNEVSYKISLEIFTLMIIVGTVIILYKYPSWKEMMQHISPQIYMIGAVVGGAISSVGVFTGLTAREMDLYIRIFYTIMSHVTEESVYIFGVFLFYQSELRKKYQKESAQKDELLKKLEQYYISLEKNQKEVRKLRHDMKKHFRMLHHFLFEDDTQNARQYLEEIETHLPDKSIPSIEVGNDLVNAMIENERAQMSDAISLVCTGLICDQVEVSAFDLCTIFTNLLSNAREACEKLKHHEKKIILYVGGNAGHFELTIQNPIEWSVDVSKIGTFTSKKDKSNHGLGLLNVIETVEKYDGMIRFSENNQQFEVYIFI